MIINKYKENFSVGKDSYCAPGWIPRETNCCIKENGTEICIDLSNNGVQIVEANNKTTIYLGGIPHLFKQTNTATCTDMYYQGRSNTGQVTKSCHAKINVQSVVPLCRESQFWITPDRCGTIEPIYKPFAISPIMLIGGSVGLLIIILLIILLISD